MRILRFLSPLLIVAFLWTNLANGAGQAIGSADTPPFTLDRRIQPLLTSIEPKAGGTAGGTLVTVSGDKFFSQHSWIKIGEVEVKNVTVTSATQLTFKTPKRVAGKVDIQVINTGGLAASLSQAYRYEAPLVKKVEVTAAETSLVANGQASTQLTIKLFDQHGQAVADETVNLVADKGKLAETADNNSDGTYSATYTAASSPGEVTIQAITSTSGQLGSLKLDLTPRQLSAEKSKVSAEEGWFTIGQSGAEVTVTLLDLDGYPLADKEVEVKVEPEAGSQLSPVEATDAKGVSQFNLQASSSGSRVVSVWLGEVVLSQQAVVKFTSDQVTEAIVSGGGVQQVGQLVAIEIRLQNEDQRPVSGKKIELLVEPASEVDLTQPSQPSDREGKLSAQLLAKTTGTKKLSVKIGQQVLADVAAMIFQPGPADKIQLSTEKKTVKPGQTAIIKVEVTDQYDNQLKKAEVVFATTLGQLGASTVNDSGAYSAIFTAPDQEGTAIITAKVGQKAGTLSLSVSNRPAITITPLTANLGLGESLQFKASEAVIWAVKGEIGSIDTKGNFKAEQEGSGQVIAILLEDPSVTASSETITISGAKLDATTLVSDLPLESFFGADLDVSGQLVLVDQPEGYATNLPLTLTFTSPTGKVFKFEPVTDAQGRYALNTVLRFDQIGVWQVELAFGGNNKLAASQKKQQITVNKAEGQLEFLSAESAELGQDYQLIGALSPALEGETLSLKILGPDASVQEAELSSQTQGGFKHQFKLNQQGRWSATVSWVGSDTFQQVSQTFQLNVVKRFGKVILALGGLGPAEGRAWTKFNSVAESVYKTFVRRNFSPQKDIYFLSPDPNQTEGAQAETTLKTLEYAITSWAAQEVNQNVPLYIYLLSHNLRDKFLVQRRGIEDDYLTPEQLDLWLDLLPAETPVTVIIEACYSGNFINSRLSAPNRTIITSASADKQAMIMRSSSFSRYFFDRIGGNQTMAEAFERTQQQMQKMATHRAQNPQIDVNGNAVSNELLDLRALGQRRIPADISSLSLPPAFASQLAAQTINQGESPTLEVELVGSNLDQVLVEIVPPSFDANVIFQDWQQAEQRVKEVDLTAVESKSGQAKYQLKYDGFDQVGEYQLIFQASNLDGFATPMQSTVTVTEASTKPTTKLTGDVNGDGTVNIFDLVIAAGSFGKTGVGIMGDVNGDGGVNIFDLVIVAGNFGKSLLAAPATAAKIELSTEQKRHIASAIDQLESNPNRSSAEEMALNVLQAVLPERLPTTTQLLANYPNPFNPETWIPFELSQDAAVTVTIYDVQGQRIRQLQLGQVTAGRYVTADQSVYWDGKSETGQVVSSGTYFYQLRAGDYTETRKMVILK